MGMKHIKKKILYIGWLITKLHITAVEQSVQATNKIASMPAIATFATFLLVCVPLLSYK
jgi:hypothetical protein